VTPYRLVDKYRCFVRQIFIDGKAFAMTVMNITLGTSVRQIFIVGRAFAMTLINITLGTSVSLLADLDH
jgi:hypothetical protein